jgi:hypothetical protein
LRIYLAGRPVLITSTTCIVEIENIWSLLEYNNEVVEKADHLSRRACDYVAYHDLVTSKTTDSTSGEDIDRLLAVRETLAGFRSAVEHSQPITRLRTLGL